MDVSAPRPYNVQHIIPTICKNSGPDYKAWQLARTDGGEKCTEDTLENPGMTANEVVFAYQVSRISYCVFMISGCHHV